VVQWRECVQGPVLAAKIRWCMTSYQAEPAERCVAGEGLASPSGGGGGALGG